MQGSEGNGWQEGDLGLGHIAFQGDPAWASPSVARGSRGWSLRIPPPLGHRPRKESQTFPSFQETHPMQGLAPRESGQERPLRPSPLRMEVQGSGQGTCSKSHSITWNVHVLSCPPLLTQPPGGLGASLLGRGLGNGAPEGGMSPGDPAWGQCGCVSPAVVCSKGVRQQQLGDPAGFQGRGRHVRVYSGQQGWDWARRGPGCRHRSVPPRVPSPRLPNFPRWSLLPGCPHLWKGCQPAAGTVHHPEPGCPRCHLPAGPPVWAVAPGWPAGLSWRKVGNLARLQPCSPTSLSPTPASLVWPLGLGQPPGLFRGHCPSCSPYPLCLHVSPAQEGWKCQAILK